ncbi:MAG: cytochrome c oxidase assembly protein [Thermomicrobiales bacterium]
MFGAQVPVVWPFYPPIILAIILCLVAYFGACGPWRRRFPGAQPVPAGRRLAFVAALVTVYVALASPVDELSDSYLFSVHMAQHLLLTLVLPPLLLIAIPGWMLRPAIRQYPALLTAGRWLTQPLVAFGLFNVVFTLYHVPALYDAVLASAALHVAAHLAFIVTGVITWWPVLSPLEELPPLAVGWQMAYLFAQTLPGQLLGALLTFSDTILYPMYARAPRVWPKLTPLVDQQLGGLLMWVGGGTFFLLAFAWVFIHWALANEARERRHRALGRV